MALRDHEPERANGAPRAATRERAATPTREPIQARSIATRERLLEAASDVLVEVGLASASTSVIAKRAGISQGAVFKHFATKPDLLAAAVERILAGFVREFRRGVDRELAKKRTDVIHAACAVLWKIFRDPGMRAVFEIYIAARTDAELARRLPPILERHRASILEEARRLFPEIYAPSLELDAAVDAVVYAMQGAAIGMFAPDEDDDVEHLAFLERLARRELARLAPGEG
jgi:AcrR family transcriptional regulator